MQDPIQSDFITVVKKTMITDLRSFMKVSCRTKFRFAELEAQCILGECGPLTSRYLSSVKQYKSFIKS